MDFTHFNEQGRAKMVDVSDKQETKRELFNLDYRRYLLLIEVANTADDINSLAVLPCSIMLSYHHLNDISLFHNKVQTMSSSYKINYYKITIK